MSAQRAPKLDIVAGTRLRVTSAAQVAPVIANYMETKSDTVYLVESEGAGRTGVWSIPYADIQKIDVSMGQRNRNMRYMVPFAGIGAGVGVAGGLLFTQAASAGSGKRFKRVATASLFGLAGGIAGAYWGSRINIENWVPMPLPTRVSLTPNGKGASIGVTVGF